MPQYMLSVMFDETAPLPADDEMQQMFKDVDVVNQEMQSTGAWVFGGGLHPTSTATVVQAKDGDIVTTDGPYAESKEVLGGFWIIKAENLDEALAWARKATVACRGPVEVRPFQDEPEPEKD